MVKVEEKIYRTCPICGCLHKAKHKEDYYCDIWCKKIAYKIIDRYKRKTIDKYVNELKSKLGK